MRRVILLMLSFCALGAKASPLIDIPFDFDETKIEEAKDAYEFMGSFAEYYYRLLKANRAHLQTVLQFDSISAWCAGDAHPKNFGAVILATGESEFALNDMDDAGPCPVVMDVLRFFVTAKLAEPKSKIKDMLEAYVDGLSGKSFSPPKSIRELLKTSRHYGFSIDPDDLSDSGRVLERDANAYELDARETAMIVSALSGKIPSTLRLLDAFATAKAGGGSSGVLRYKLLFQFGRGLLHLELKGQPDPAITPVALEPVPATAARIQRTVDLEMGPQASPFYQTVVIDGAAMLMRPRYRGNLRAEVNDGDNSEVTRYEAYALGKFHARSLRDVQGWTNSLRRAYWAKDVYTLVDHFEDKFASLGFLARRGN